MRTAVQQRFALVSPIDANDVDLEMFLGCLEEQTSGLGTLEVLLLDDGRREDGRRIARQWVARFPRSATILETRPGFTHRDAVAALAHARARWATFRREGDLLAADYFEKVGRTLRRHGEDTLSLVVTRCDQSGSGAGERSSARHELDLQRAGLKRGAYAVDSLPFAHASAVTTFYLRERLLQLTPSFWDELPGFGAAITTARYLTRGPGRVALVPDAHYLRGSHGGETSGASMLTEAPVDLLRDAAAARAGQVPRWLQRTVLAALQADLLSDRRVDGPSATVGAATADRFHRIVRDTLQYVEDEVILSQSSPLVDDEVRFALFSYRGAEVSPRVQVTSYDHGQQLVQLTYYFRCPEPVVEFRLDDRGANPAHTKARARIFWGRALFHQRIIWLPANGQLLQVHVDGRPVPLSVPPPASRIRTGATHASLRLPLRAVRRAFPDARGARHGHPFGLRNQRWRLTQALAVPALHRLRRQPLVPRRWARAWVLTDRCDRADDNAEHLYRWIREHRPRINAWFLLDDSSPDWDRLAAEGFRLLDWRSWERFPVLLFADHVISSHLDAHATTPLGWAVGDLSPARFTYLRHGVSKDDMSIWLDTKPIDRLITSTPAEHASIVDDGNPYRYTTMEARLTGLPRHDELLRRSRTVTPRAVTFMPTWRRWLGDVLREAPTSAAARTLASTAYAEGWRTLLRCDRLHQLALHHGRPLLLVPHPLLLPHLSALDLPPHVHVVTPDEAGYQDVFCRSAVLVTDYSSAAFDLALLRRPTVYYQFDRQQLDSGGHIYRRGYFDYERDGFGPVEAHPAEVVEHIDRLLTAGCPDRFLQRMDRTFPDRDGQARRRVFDAIVELTRSTPEV
jgi:hypothetical protein